MAEHDRANPQGRRSWPEDDFMPHPVRPDEFPGRQDHHPRDYRSGYTGGYSGGYSGGASSYNSGVDGWRAGAGFPPPRESYAGRGPRGYKRSDARVQDDVSDQLEQDHFVDASDIDVTVHEGLVTLAGTVASREQKRRAEDCAADVRGVQDVSNQLRLRRPDQAPASEVSSSLLGLGGQPPKDGPARS